MHVLLIKTSSMGDVIHNLPVVSDIRARYPDAKIDWLVEESFASIPALHPGVADVIQVAIRRWRKNLFSAKTWSEIAAFDHGVHREKYDYVIDTQGLLKSALLASRSVGVHCGYDAKSARESIASKFYDRRITVSTHLHAVERNRQLVALALGYEIDTPLNYGVTAANVRKAAEATAVLLTATSRDDKLWLEDRWIALGKALSASGMTCVLPGGSEVERERAARIAAEIPQAVVLPPLGLAALAGKLAGARVVVGVDTGLVHLAAALGRPTVALYCASDPQLTGVLADTPFQNLGSRGRPPALEAVLQSVSAMLKLPASLS
jgi:heptosyltransferase I